MRARNLAAKTLRTYGDSLDSLIAYTSAKEIADLDRNAIRSFLAAQAEQYAPATVSVRYRALQQFFKWLVLEEELDRSPMDVIRPPVVPEQPVDIPTDAEIKAVLKVCAGTGLVERRDTAIIRLFLDTGMRYRSWPPESRRPGHGPRRRGGHGQGQTGQNFPIRCQDRPGRRALSEGEGAPRTRLRAGAVAR